MECVWCGAKEGTPCKRLTAPSVRCWRFVVPSGVSALLEAYRRYSEAIKAKPYCPDTVQAFGLAFYAQWVGHKKVLCGLFEIDEDAFEYSLHHIAMPKLVEHFNEYK
jgi:hypothetical protein